MSERTYSRADLEASRAAWADFGDEWREARRIAAGAGMLYPPSGTRWDDRDDAQPSQRAIVWAALDDRPRSTLATIARSRSWSAVVRAVMAEEGRLREDADLAERDAAWEREQLPDPREATTAIKRILDRIGAS